MDLKPWFSKPISKRDMKRTFLYVSKQTETFVIATLVVTQRTLGLSIVVEILDGKLS